MPLDRSEIIETLRRVHLFRGVEDARLEAAADLFEQVEVPAGQVLYQQGDAVDYFYIVATGRARLTRQLVKGGQALTLGYMEQDDFFGQEVLENDWPRQVNAETVEDSTLLRANVDMLIKLLEVIPFMGQRLQFALDNYRQVLRAQGSFSWPDTDECIYYVARRHILFLIAMMLPPVIAGFIGIPMFVYFFLQSFMLTTAVLLAIVILVVFAWLIWSYVDWTNDYYIVTNQRVLYQERVVLLYDSRQESPFDAIQSTSINTSQWGRWFGYGNVAIRTYTGTILFRNVAHPEQVMSLIQEHQLRAQFRMQRTELRNIKKIIKDRIASGPIAPTPPRPRPPQAKPSMLREFLSTMFHLRYEVNGTIIYRTHWFVLLKKIFLPSMFLIGLVTLFIYSAGNRFPLLSAMSTCSLSLLFGMIAFGWWFYQYMDWHNDLYLISQDQVIDVSKKPLGHEQRQAAPLNNILSIEYKRLGIPGLVLNFGTVYIRVGDQSLTFDDVFNPSEVQRVLFHSLARKKFAERQSSLAEERKRLADWFATYDELRRENGGQQPPRNPPAGAARGGF